MIALIALVAAQATPAATQTVASSTDIIAAVTDCMAATAKPGPTDLALLAKSGWTEQADARTQQQIEHNEHIYRKAGNAAFISITPIAIFGLDRNCTVASGLNATSDAAAIVSTLDSLLKVAHFGGASTNIYNWAAPKHFILLTAGEEAGGPTLAIVAKYGS